MEGAAASGAVSGEAFLPAASLPILKFGITEVVISGDLLNAGNAGSLPGTLRGLLHDELDGALVFVLRTWICSFWPAAVGNV
jgi:hypothetical protein